MLKKCLVYKGQSSKPLRIERDGLNSCSLRIYEDTRSRTPEHILFLNIIFWNMIKRWNNSKLFTLRHHKISRWLKKSKHFNRMLDQFLAILHLCFLLFSKQYICDLISDTPWAQICEPQFILYIPLEEAHPLKQSVRQSYHDATYLSVEVCVKIIMAVDYCRLLRVASWKFFWAMKYLWDLFGLFLHFHSPKCRVRHDKVV